MNVNNPHTDFPPNATFDAHSNSRRSTSPVHGHVPAHHHKDEIPQIQIPSHAIIRCLELRKISSILDFLKVACVKSVLLHILFSRGVIPCPAQHLLDKLEADAKAKALVGEGDNAGVIDDKDLHLENKENRRVASAVAAPVAATKVPPTGGMKRKRADIIRERKYQKHGVQIKSVLDDLDALFDTISSANTKTNEDRGGANKKTEEGDVDATDSNESRIDSGVKAVLITLGPSFQSPREQYLIRFHAWGQERRREGGITSIINHANKNIPPSVQKRLQREIGRRSVRELLNGTLEEDYSTMFEPRGGVGNGQNSSIKVNVACLLEDHAIGKIFHHGPTSTSTAVSSFHSTLGMGYGGNNDSSTMSIVNVGNQQLLPLSTRFIINRNLEVKEPRMFSKSRGIHRPFAVLDVIPKSQPPTNNIRCISDNEDDMDTDEDKPTFSREKGDTWVSLRSYIKGFRA